MAELQATPELAPSVGVPSDAQLGALGAHIDTPAPSADRRAASPATVESRSRSVTEANRDLSRALELNSNPLEPDVLEAVTACLKSGADAQQIPAISQWKTRLLRAQSTSKLEGAEKRWVTEARGLSADAVQNLLDSRTLNLRNPEVASNVREIAARWFFSGYSLDVVSQLLERNGASENGLISAEFDVLQAWSDSVANHLDQATVDDDETVDGLLAEWCRNGKDERWRNPRATLIEVSSVLGVRSPRD